MPSTSQAQHNFMEGIAHGMKPRSGHGPSKAVAEEFVSADKGKYREGGRVKVNSQMAGGGGDPEGGIGGHNDGHGIYAKGSKPQDAHYAEGGPVLERSGDWKKTVPNRGFLDTPDRFTGGRKPAGYPKESETAENWSKSGGPQGNIKPADKSEKPTKPRS